jgi:hypothetical protein
MYKIILESNEGSERTRATFETDQQEITYLVDGFNGLLVAHGFQFASIENNIIERAEEITVISDMDYDING